MDIVTRLERIPVSRFHYKLLAVTGLGWLFDAMDTGIIAFVLPVLAKTWGLTTAQMGYIGSIGLLGMALGAVLSGWAADRFGRKNVFAATVLIYSVATGLCALAPDYYTLLALRFLVGFGLGGELPVAVTLMTEFSPPEARGRFIVLLESFWGLGWLAAALVSYLIIPKFGWHAAFIVGAIPAIYVFVIRMASPESVRYLLSKGKIGEAHRIVSDMEIRAGMEPVKEAVAPAAHSVVERPAFGELWRSGFARRTVMLWIAWFGIVYSYYGIFTWLPSLMVGQGHTIVKSFEFVLIMTLAQMPGYFSAAYLVDKIGRKPTLALYLGCCAVTAFMFGKGGSAAEILFWGSLMSFFNLGAWGVIYTYTPELYPTRIRAFGSGWAAAVGRTGGMLAPAIVGFMVAGAGGFSKVFGMFTAVMLAVAAAVWFLGEETKQRPLDEISR